MELLFNVVTDKREHSDLLLQDESETLSQVMLQEPFLKWVTEYPDLLNEQLVEAIAMMLLPLEKEGERFLGILSDLTDEHKHLASRIINFMTSNRNTNLFGGLVTYDMLNNIGYSGPIQLGDPVSSAFRKLDSIKLLNRGIEVTPKGVLTLNANVFSEYVLRRMTLFLYEAKVVYAYSKEGKFVQVNDEYLKKICREILHESMPNIWTVKWENEYFTALKRSMPLAKTLDPNLHLINLKNGLMNLETMQLMPHDPKYLSTVQTNMNYDPTATCPNFMNYLVDIFEGDQERIDLVQEMLGYCFLRDVKLHRAFIFLGKGSNGKSVLAEIIRHLIGEENVSNVPLSALGTRFGMQNLPGKMVNISSENEFDKKFNTQNFKALTGGDAVNVEKKHQDSFNIKLYLKVIILLNRMMDSDDLSPGFYRRLSIIPFKKQYVELKAGEVPEKGVSYMDKNLTGRLLKELDGILTFALNGLHRLIHNEFNLSHSTASEQALAEYVASQNPVIRFYEELVEVDPSAKVKRSDFGKAYKDWALHNHSKGYRDFNSSKFLSDFRQVVKDNHVTISEKKIQGHQYIEGLQLKSVIEYDPDYVPGN